MPGETDRAFFDILLRHCKTGIETTNPDSLQALNDIANSLDNGIITIEEATQQLVPYMPPGDQNEKFDDILKPAPLHEDIQSSPSYGRRQKSQRWTEEEDKKLMSAMQHFGQGNWGAVATYVGNNRSRSQCSQRWNRVLNPDISKTNWNYDEETKLIESVSKHGSKAWKRVSGDMINRSDVQCRFKYNFLLKKGDERISRYSSNGTSKESDLIQ